MVLSGVEALVFDVFGTVVDWRSGVARDAAAFLARHGKAEIDAGVFADAWRRRYMPAMEEVRSGRRPFTPAGRAAHGKTCWPSCPGSASSLQVSRPAKSMP